MKRLIKSRQEAGEQSASADGHTGRDTHATATAAGDPAGKLVYDIRQSHGFSSRFYGDVSAFTDELLAAADLRAGHAIRDYGQFVQDELKEAPRSLGEYSLEFLMLGHAFSRHAGAAEMTPWWVVNLASELVWLRHGSSRLKHWADFARSVLTRVFFLPHMRRKATSTQMLVDRLPRIIEWLQATGEFEQEAMRLNNWNAYLATVSSAQALYLCETAAGLFDWFRPSAERLLGSYTTGVPCFLAEEYAHRTCRDDQILCAARPVEYHLNMVAAEIVNRGMREKYAATPQRVVLVPSCMRGACAGSCRARQSGMDYTCTGCDPDCTVNQITRRMRTLGALVYIIPHSTGFSRWLSRWQGLPECGVVAAACMLNILPGGLEMRTCGIASQCVPLDFPGCRKHWSHTRIPTSLNLDRLAQIVQIGMRPSPPKAVH